MPINDDDAKPIEWLETDQLGGYGMGTSDLVPTRRYHALFITPDESSERRTVLLHTPIVELIINGARHSLSSFQFSDGTIHPNGNAAITHFSTSPWPTWEFEFSEGTLRYEFLLLKGVPSGLIRWSFFSPTNAAASLRFRPFLSMRDHHHLTAKHRYSEAQMNAEGSSHSWRRDQNSPAIFFSSTASYQPNPLWFENFFYAEEQNRGYDCREDLFSPGYFEFPSVSPSVTLKFSAHRDQCYADIDGRRLEKKLNQEIEAERARRRRIKTIFHHAAADYKVRRNKRASIIAGYPWFSDWGRDTFISIRGLCYALGDFAFAKEIIFSWRETVRDGLIPNRFPDTASETEYHSIDATLWYLIAIGELLSFARRDKVHLTRSEKRALAETATGIFDALIKGTGYNIRVTDDSLLQGGEVGRQLTWMDAKVGDWVVTPRSGKPVEIQALWINALFLLRPIVSKMAPYFSKARASFESRFWLPDLGYLADVVDVDHRAGEVDITFRPNQVFAIGGLPYSLVERPRALKILKRIEHELLTPYGLRTLSPSDTRYRGHCRGDMKARDAAYHQGTIWPWLIGGYAEAFLKAHKNSSAAKRQVREKLLAPLTRLAINENGHIPEIFEGAIPHRAEGAPFQAWSMGELIRISQLAAPRSKLLVDWLVRLFA